MEGDSLQNRRVRQLVWAGKIERFSVDAIALDEAWQNHVERKHRGLSKLGEASAV
jgi:hypothetical protein